MTTIVYPPIEREALVQAERESLARELQWFLSHLHTETLSSLKAGLEECDRLLSPDSGAHTLVLSSLRSESVKGFITRTGTRIVKGTLALKLASIPPPRGRESHQLTISQAADAPTLALDQLTRTRNLISNALDVIDVTKWTGNAEDANFIAGQLTLLFEHVRDAKGTLKGVTSVSIPGGPSRPVTPVTELPPQLPRVETGERPWNLEPHDENIFEPSCPPNISLHLSIADAALVLQVRALERADAPPSQESVTGFGIRGRLGLAPRHQTHDEVGEVFEYKGHDVKVKEKLRVESQDPSLLAAMAKLSALEHSVAMSRTALDTVMEKEDD
ncbi:MAG: hypothetical protein Q9159_003250 [Coniocarpon cinnabarinum]